MAVDIMYGLALVVLVLPIALFGVWAFVELLGTLKCNVAQCTIVLAVVGVVLGLAALLPDTPQEKLHL